MKQTQSSFNQKDSFGWHFSITFLISLALMVLILPAFASADQSNLGYGNPHYPTLDNQLTSSLSSSMNINGSSPFYNDSNYIYQVNTNQSIWIKENKDLYINDAILLQFMKDTIFGYIDGNPLSLTWKQCSSGACRLEFITTGDTPYPVGISRLFTDTISNFNGGVEPLTITSNGELDLSTGSGQPIFINSNGELDLESNGGQDTNINSENDINLNPIGDAKVNGVKICLEDGTDCPSAPSSNSTFNATYNALLNQNCPAGQVVNGTYSNGTFKCTTVTSSGNISGAGSLNQVAYFTAAGTISSINNLSFNGFNINFNNNISASQFIGNGSLLNSVCLSNGTNCNATVYTFNSTYNSLLNQNCPAGQVVNGTYSNGTFKCTTVSSSGGFASNGTLNYIPRIFNSTYITNSHIQDVDNIINFSEDLLVSTADPKISGLSMTVATTGSGRLLLDHDGDSYFDISADGQTSTWHTDSGSNLVLTNGLAFTADDGSFASIGNAQVILQDSAGSQLFIGDDLGEQVVLSSNAGLRLSSNNEAQITMSSSGNFLITSTSSGYSGEVSAEQVTICSLLNSCGTRILITDGMSINSGESLDLTSGDDQAITVTPSGDFNIINNYAGGFATHNYGDFISEAAGNVFTNNLSMSQHILSTGSATTVNTCGVTPFISGNDLSGNVTIGTGVITACTVIFNKQYAKAPHCFINSRSTTVFGDSTANRTAFVASFSASLAGGQFDYFCVQ